jgi:hypothetical protein
LKQKLVNSIQSKPKLYYNKDNKKIKEQKIKQSWSKILQAKPKTLKDLMSHHSIETNNQVVLIFNK